MTLTRRISATMAQFMDRNVSPKKMKTWRYEQKRYQPTTSRWSYSKGVSAIFVS